MVYDAADELQLYGLLGADREDVSVALNMKPRVLHGNDLGAAGQQLRPGGREGSRDEANHGLRQLEKFLRNLCYKFVKTW
mmetsp:Transcript_17926/g.42155  ORF Transcript_17926/g.42155 Transcript_17926/m.42155 type:complete len:80 (-) Transcript_17926:841-1080(-)